jgi:PAS domain S-box-containing protein
MRIRDSLAAAVWLSVALWPGAAGAAPAQPGAAVALLWLLTACAAVVACAWAVRERQRLRRLAAGIHERLAADDREAHGARPVDPLQALDRALELSHEQARREAAARLRAEADLRESQERYTLAVRGATDGLWEWNFRTRAAYFSTRAKSMLGFAEDEIGHSVEEWRARIHPEDLRSALADLRAYIAGRRERFEVEHRMRHKDGSWRWVLARATVVRHASGKPERLIGLYSDITPRKRVQQLLLDLADGLSGLQGEACLNALVRCFAQTLGVREAFVCECSDHPTTRVRMLARWKGGQEARCVEFDLAGTACEEVIQSGCEVFVPRAAGERWPVERLFERDSYLGLPCLDSSGRVIGHVACADPAGMPDELPHRAVLKIFALRAALELERRLLVRERATAQPPGSAVATAAIH